MQLAENEEAFSSPELPLTGTLNFGGICPPIDNIPDTMVQFMLASEPLQRLNAFVLLPEIAAFMDPWTPTVPLSETNDLAGDVMNWESMEVSTFGRENTSFSTCSECCLVSIAPCQWLLGHLPGCVLEVLDGCIQEATCGVCFLVRKCFVCFVFYSFWSDLFLAGFRLPISPMFYLCMLL